MLFQKKDNENLNNSIKGNKEEKNIKHLISTLILEYLIAPNYTIIENINNFKNFFDNANNKDKMNSDFGCQIIIKSESELKRNINNINYIIKIKLNCPNFHINLLKVDWSNLKKLNLSHCCLDNIEILGKAKFENLESLDLSYNFLTDESTKIIKNSKIPNLIKLNLSYNQFTDYEIFAIQHFEKLIKLKLNSNHFKFNKKDEKKLNIIFKKYNDYIYQMEFFQKKISRKCLINFN